MVKSCAIDAIIPQLKEAVAGNSSVVLQAPPGSGKTTRVPLALLDILPPEKGRILMLEPRRIAAVSASRWMAGTIGEQAGETVGYSIRFESRVSKKTRIEVVTEGILARRILADPGLEGIALVIFDEFHERSIHADLALALCLDVRRHLREELKILVMSATLDCGPVASLLGAAPVISSEGETFPVEERYAHDSRGSALRERISEAVCTALRETSGDLLVFLPGAGEIRSCTESVRKVLAGEKDGISLHPLYGDLPFDEQERALLPSRSRKIVFATNIAETSLTIEGVGVVIDSGLTRRLQYDPSTGMNRLITSTVSQAAANQRKGRAGRLGPGVCYRLYSRHAYESMLPFAPPEILVSDLSSLALDLAVWGERDPAALSWLDPPPGAAWDSAVRLLKDLDALDQEGMVTPTGRSMARLPLHPRLGRLLMTASELGYLQTGADLASLLSERDILLRGPSSPRSTAGASNVSGRLDTLRQWRKEKEAPAEADPWALRGVDRTARQLMHLISRGQETFTKGTDRSDLVPLLLLHAFPDRIAKRRADDENSYLISGGRGVRLPASESPGESPFIIAVKVDAGEKAEGMVHLAEHLPEELIRKELSGQIETVRRFEWDRREGKIIAEEQECLGSIVLSARPLAISDREAAPLLCNAIRSTPGLIIFSDRAKQFLGRVSLMRRTFPEEEWPDLSEARLISEPENWLLPWLNGIRSARQLEAIDLLPAVSAQLSWKQLQLLERRMPLRIIVPSGHGVPLDYGSGDIPVLSVKLQEMFGLGDTPSVGEGRVKVLLHLLSPARRPVQITRDLKSFWERGYQEVKKDLKGRYPKHPWPDDPWNAAPTRRSKPRGR